MRVRALIPFLALLLTAPALAATGEADAARRRGLEAMARSDWPAAAVDLAAAVEAFSRDGRVVELAATLEELGTVQLSGLADPVAALATFERAAAIAERPASAWLWAALAAEQAGRPALARIYKQRALGGTAATPPAAAADPAPAVPAAPAPSPSAVPAAEETSVPVARPASAERAPAVPPAPALSTPSSKPEPPAPVAEPTPFTHFFGAPSAAAPVATTPPASTTSEEGAPAAAPSPFAHFFGPQPGPAPGTGVPAATAPPSGPAPPAPPATATQTMAPANPSAASSPPAKGEAFQHFFGAKPKTAPKSDEKSAAPESAPPTPPPPTS